MNGFYIPATPALCADAKGNPVVLDSYVGMDKRGEVNPVNPANIERLESFFGKNELMIRSFVYPCEVSERNREKAAKELFINYGVMAAPETAGSYATILENKDEILNDDGTFVLVSHTHPALSADYCRHVLGETPDIPENIAESLKPVILKQPVISSLDELKELLKTYID